MSYYSSSQCPLESHCREVGPRRTDALFLLDMKNLNTKSTDLKPKPSIFHLNFNFEFKLVDFGLEASIHSFYLLRRTSKNLKNASLSFSGWPAPYIFWCPLVELPLEIDNFFLGTLQPKCILDFLPPPVKECITYSLARRTRALWGKIT